MRVLMVNPEDQDNFGTLKEMCLLFGRRAVCAPLALPTIAALLPADWDIRMVDLNARPLEESDWQRAEMVMLTATIAQKDRMLKVVREAKARGKIVVVGGSYVSSVPERALEAGCDFLFRGEAEDTVPVFLEDLRRGKTSGTYEASEKPDLTRSPIPRFDILNFEDYLYVCVQTSRGCPFSCEFCDVIQLFGRRPRYKTNDQVLAEFDAIQRVRGSWRGDLFVVDDNFIGNQKVAASLLDAIAPWMKQNRFPFSLRTQATINLSKQPELMKKMVNANFSSIYVGFESPDDEVLLHTKKRINVHNPMVEAIEVVTRAGLLVSGSFIFGFDGERTGLDQRIAAFAEVTDVPWLFLNVMKALPHTALWKRLEKEGRLLEDADGDDWEQTFSTPNFVPTRPEQEILDEYVNAFYALYEPNTFLQRSYRYYLKMPPRAPDRAPQLTRAERRWFLRILVQIVGRQLRRPYRGRFVRHVIGLLRKNPSRLLDYVFNAATGEPMYKALDEWKTGAKPRPKFHGRTAPLVPAAAEASEPLVKLGLRKADKATLS